jgi:hypothetical protein
MIGHGDTYLLSPNTWGSKNRQITIQAAPDIKQEFISNMRLSDSGAEILHSKLKALSSIPQYHQYIYLYKILV